MDDGDLNPPDDYSLLDNPANAEQGPGNIARGIKRFLTKQFFSIPGKFDRNGNIILPNQNESVLPTREHADRTTKSVSPSTLPSETASNVKAPQGTEPIAEQGSKTAQGQIMPKIILTNKPIGRPFRNERRTIIQRISGN